MHLALRSALPLLLGLSAPFAAPAAVPGTAAVPAEGPRTAGVGSADAVGDIVDAFAELSTEDQLRAIEGLRQTMDRQLLSSGPDKMGQFTISDGVQVHRLLNRGPFEGLTLGRGGGAYFSFTSSTQRNDYDTEPDLELQHFKFHSGFAGGDAGAIVPMPGVNIDTATVENAPVALFLAAPDEVDDLGRVAPEAVVGQTYAVRSVRWKESDVLVAVEVLQRDPYGITFAWKLLKVYEVPVRGR